jgi:hypothetical protein
MDRLLDRRDAAVRKRLGDDEPQGYLTRLRRSRDFWGGNVLH